MKKLLSLFLALALILGAVPATVFAGGGEPEFPGEEIKALIRPTDDGYTGHIDPYGYEWVEFYSGSEGYYVFESFGSDDVKISIYDSEGNYLSGDDDSGEEMNFRAYCYVDYKSMVYLKIEAGISGWEADYTVKADYSDIESVYVIHRPYKTEYTLGIDTYPDAVGLQIEIRYKNNTTLIWQPGVEVRPTGVTSMSYSFEFNTPELIPETLNIVLNMYGVKRTFAIKVNNYPYKSAELITPPDRDNYIIGTDYGCDMTGAEIKLTRYDGGIEYYSFDDFSSDYPQFPYEYTVGSYYNMEHGYWDINYSSPGPIQLHLIFGYLDVPFSRNVIEFPYSAMSVIQSPYKTTYYTGLECPHISVDGMIIRCFYKNSLEYKDIYLNDYNDTYDGQQYYAFWEDDKVKSGENEITFEYMDMLSVFTVFGADNPVTGIEILKAPKKTTYFCGRDGFPEIDPDGLEVKINYADSTYDIWPQDADHLLGIPNIYQINMLEPGLPASVDVEYMGSTATFQIYGFDMDVTNVYLSTMPDRTSYYNTETCDDFDPEGLTFFIETPDLTIIWGYDEGDISWRLPSAFASVNGYMEVLFNVCGFDVPLYVTVDTLDVINLEPKTYPHKDGTGFSAECTLYGGGTFMIETDLFQKCIVDNFYTGTFEFLPDTHFVFYCEAYNDSVTFYAFNGEIVLPYASGADKGDFDGDGVITVADALAALRIGAKLVEETPEAIAIGDTDNDGHVTVADALAILRVAAKLVDHL